MSICWVLSPARGPISASRAPGCTSDGSAVLHIIAGRPLPEQRAGVLDHMAFSASGLADVKAKLDAKKISYELRRQRGAGTWQLFCYDPSGAKVELDFDPSESA